MADVALPHAAMREQVADAIDLVVHQRRERDGRDGVAVTRSAWRGVAARGRTRCATGAPLARRWRC